MNLEQKDFNCFNILSLLNIISITHTQKQRTTSPVSKIMQANALAFHPWLLISLMLPTQMASRMPIISTLPIIEMTKYLILLNLMREMKQIVYPPWKIVITIPEAYGLLQSPTQTQMMIVLVRRESRMLFLAYHFLLVICSRSTQQLGSSTWNFFQLLITATAISITTTTEIARTERTKGAIWIVITSFMLVSWIREDRSRALKVRVMSLTGKITFFLRRSAAVGLWTILSVNITTVRKTVRMRRKAIN